MSMDDLLELCSPDENTNSKNLFDFSNESELEQEDVWTVIDAYFRKKGLINQQTDSFDEFIENTMQEIIDTNGKINIIPENQYNSKNDSNEVIEKYYPCFFVISNLLFSMHTPSNSIRYT